MSPLIFPTVGQVLAARPHEHKARLNITKLRIALYLTRSRMLQFCYFLTNTFSFSLVVHLQSYHTVLRASTNSLTLTHVT